MVSTVLYGSDNPLATEKTGMLFKFESTNLVRDVTLIVTIMHQYFIDIQCTFTQDTKARARV